MKSASENEISETHLIGTHCVHDLAVHCLMQGPYLPLLEADFTIIAVL